MRPRNPAAFANPAFLYCALFHQGSMKACGAFRAGLKTFHETGYCDRAVEDHFISKEYQLFMLQIISTFS